MWGRALPENWLPLTIAVILMTVSAMLVMLNLAPDPAQPLGTDGPLITRQRSSQAIPQPGEGLIGQEVGRNRLVIRAEYRSIVRAGGPESTPGPIRLEVDVYADNDNPQAITPGSFVPYLQLTYRIEPASGGRAIEEGVLKPSVAKGGMYYGATVNPQPGSYKLVLKLAPPGNTVDRATDDVTGVAPWWEPFTLAFPWEFPTKFEPNP